MEPTEKENHNPPDIVLYGGKGGVGKTTCAAAHAVGLSERDASTKVLVVSTDPAHSLGDVFERNLGDEPTALTDSLAAVEVGSQRGQEAYRMVVETLVDEFRSAGLRVGEDELERLFEAGLIPGGDEVAALEYIARYTDSEYETVIFDTAPTGHTLRLLDLPEVLGETFAVASEIQQRVRRVAKTARSMVFGPEAYWETRDDSEELTSLRDRIATVDSLLHDPSRTHFRVVLTPERMSIAETERLVSRLKTANVPVDSLVVNRLFENDQACSCERCCADAERHEKRLQEIQRRFNLPVRVVPELDTEAQGALSAIGPTLLAVGDSR